MIGPAAAPGSAVASFSHRDTSTAGAETFFNPLRTLQGSELDPKTPNFEGLMVEIPTQPLSDMNRLEGPTPQTI